MYKHIDTHWDDLYLLFVTISEYKTIGLNYHGSFDFINSLNNDPLYKLSQNYYCETLYEHRYIDEVCLTYRVSPMVTHNHIFTKT